jgi:sugar lactone lactonase YvrE
MGRKTAFVVAVAALVAGVIGSGDPVGAAPGDDCATQSLTINNASDAPPSPAFIQPLGVAIDGSGDMYVADFASDTVYGFDADGVQFLTINNASATPPAPAFVQPRGVAVDGSGNVYVADDVSDTVYGFTSAGVQFLTINNASASPPSPAFSAPGGVAVDGSGNLFVADLGGTVYGFTAGGVQFLTINAASAAPPAPAFIDPFAVAVDGSGNVYVADFDSDTVYGFTSAGVQFLTINAASAAPPDPAFSSPFGVAVDGGGNVYVTDTASDTVYGFTAGGVQFLTINNASAAPPAPAFIDPLGVAVDWSGNVYVADLFSATVYRFAVDPECGVAQPDGAVRVQGVPPLVGNDIYGPPDGQTVTATKARGQTVTFDVRIQNDGAEPDSFELAGTPSIPATKATYLRGASGSTNITSAVVAGTYVTPELAPGAAHTVRLQVKVQAGAVSGSIKPYYVTATSVDDGTTTDTIRARVKVT